MLQFFVCGVIKTNNKILDEIKHVLYVSIILLSLTLNLLAPTTVGARINP
jgi:hypothetical protein